MSEEPTKEPDIKIGFDPAGVPSDSVVWGSNALTNSYVDWKQVARRLHKPNSDIVKWFVDVGSKVPDWQKSWVDAYTAGQLATPLSEYKPRTWGSTTGRYHSYDASITKAMLSFTTAAQTIRGTAAEMEVLAESFFPPDTAEQEREKAVRAEAKVAVTDEKVYTLVEQHYLPHDYARRLLEEAYVDSILNEGNTNDTPTA